jgi:hypothetical protein
MQNSMGSMAGSAMPAGGVANQAGFAGSGGAAKDENQAGQSVAGSSADSRNNPSNSNTQTENHNGRVSTGQSSTIGSSDTVKPAGSAAMGQAAQMPTGAANQGSVSSDVSKPEAQANNQPPAPHWGTAQMAAPPSTASAETKQIQQQYAAGHGAPQTPSALPAQALSGTQTGTKSDVVKPNRS